jgi:hypothetical protein
MILSRRRPRARPPGHRHACRSTGHAVKLGPALAVGITLTVAAAACSSSSSSAGGAAHTSAPAPSTSAPASSAAMSTLGAHSLPAQTAQTLPAFPAFYDAHKDVVVVSDAYPKAAAGTFHANYAPSLSAVLPASQPAWYIVRGPAAPGQIAVLGSEPGESDYSPLWQTVIVRWKPGVTPQVLTSDNMILDLAKKGQLTATKTVMVVNSTVTAVKGTPASSAAAPASRLGAGSLPAQASQTLPAFPAFYDAHKDVVVVSDAYPKAAAPIFHANYAPSLGAVKPGLAAGLVHRARPGRGRSDRRAGVRARGKRLLAAVADGDRPVEARRHAPGADQRQHDPRPGQEGPAHRHENGRDRERHPSYPSPEGNTGTGCGPGTWPWPAFSRSRPGSQPGCRPVGQGAKPAAMVPAGW